MLPAVALAVVLMTIPVDLDPTSTTTRAACHLTLVPISLAAVRRLGR